MTINLGILSKYRSELMGLSAIAILICHAPGNDVMMSGALSWICALGGYGVDVFLFLSGFGLWYSLEDRVVKSFGILQWYKKRYIRLFIPYVLIALPYGILYCILEEENFIFFLEYISTIGFWTSHKGVWFIDALVPLYLLAPAIYVVFKKTNNSWLILLILFFLPLVLAFMPNYSIDKYHTIWGNVQFVLYRVPNFVLGIWIAPYIKNNREVRHSELYILVSIIMFISCWSVDLWGPPFLTLPILMFFLIMIHYLNNIGGAIWRFMGKISLESYMFNVTLPFFLIQGRNWEIGGFDVGYGNYIPYGCVIILGTLGAKCVNKLSKLAIKKIV